MDDDLRSILHRAVRAGVAPGLVAGWQHLGEDRPRVHATGRSVVIPPSVAMTTETWFDLASLTKPMVIGTLGVLLIRDGSLSLTTKVAEVLPETAESALGARTVIELLTHSAGMPGWEPLYALTEQGTDGPLEALCDLTVGEAGAHVVYSCPGFIVLGMIFQRLTRSRLDELFGERVLGPLELENELAFLADPSHPIVGGASTPAAESAMLEERGLDLGSIPSSRPGQPDDGNARFLGGVAGNAGLFGTIAGVLGLARAYLEPGVLFSSDEISMAATDHTPGLEQARGLAWQIASSTGCSAGPALSPSAFGHSGFTGTSLWIDPARGISMALLSNRNHPGHRLNDLHPLRRRFHELVINHVS